MHPDRRPPPVTAWRVEHAPRSGSENSCRPTCAATPRIAGSSGNVIGNSRPSAPRCLKVRPCRSRTHCGMQREANHPRSMAQTKGAARQERVRRGIAPPNGSFWPMCDEPRHYICGNVLNDTDRREDHVREPPTLRLLDHTHAVLGGGSRCLARGLSRQRMAGGEDCRPQFSGERQARRQGIRPCHARWRPGVGTRFARRVLPRSRRISPRFHPGWRRSRQSWIQSRDRGERRAALARIQISHTGSRLVRGADRRVCPSRPWI